MLCSRQLFTGAELASSVCSLKISRHIGTSFLYPTRNGYRYLTREKVEIYHRCGSDKNNVTVIQGSGLISMPEQTTNWPVQNQDCQEGDQDLNQIFYQIHITRHFTRKFLLLHCFCFYYILYLKKLNFDSSSAQRKLCFLVTSFEMISF